MFNSYATHNKIADDGIEKFFSDIGLDLADLEVLVISYYMKADEMGKFTYDQFKKGCTELGVDTLDKWKALVPQMKKSWRSDDALFKKVYSFAFKANREPGKNNVDRETCIALWEMFMSDKCLFLQKWISFLNEVAKPNIIKEDQWV